MRVRGAWPYPDRDAKPKTLTPRSAAPPLTRDLRDEDVLSVFSGLRPLVRSGHQRRTAALSREHTIIVSQSGLLTVTGGKWTTYRRMAEEVVDQAARLARLGVRPCGTENLRLHGWKNEASEAGHFAGYGSDAMPISAFIQSNPALGGLIHPRLPYRQGEVVWQARHEMARTVEDVLARRTRALLLDARASSEAAPVVARLLGRELGHSASWEQSQVIAYQQLARGYIFTDPASCRSPVLDGKPGLSPPAKRQLSSTGSI